MKKYYCDTCTEEINGKMVILYESGERLELCWSCGLDKIRENPKLKQGACYTWV